MELEQVGAPKVSSEKAQRFLAQMEDGGYPFRPLVKEARKNRGKTKKCKVRTETSQEYTTRIKGVVREAIRLARVSTVYDDVFSLIRESTGEDKEKWLVVEDLLNDEGIRLRTKLGIQARDPGVDRLKKTA